MSRIKKLLSAYDGRMYVYLCNNAIAVQFAKDAENEGFTFCDGVKPTERALANIIAINRDTTINYVGFNGRVAYQAASEIGDQPLVKIDYRDILKQ